MLFAAFVAADVVLLGLLLVAGRRQSNQDGERLPRSSWWFLGEAILLGAVASVLNPLSAAGKASALTAALLAIHLAAPGRPKDLLPASVRARQVATGPRGVQIDHRSRRLQWRALALLVVLLGLQVTLFQIVGLPSG